ncbi:MAG: DUF4032 domain-containing protein [Marmoricola sp.]
MRVIASRPAPGLLGLAWDRPLEEWTEHVVPVPRGLSRHVVRVIQLEGGFYAVKETDEDLAGREYRLLRRLARRGLPAVQPEAVVSGRPHDLPAALVTRHLSYALSYRTVFTNGHPRGQVDQLLDALVVLLVRLHLGGFYWGDVSLSNTLFRRSAGEYAAYLVDAETGELHDQVSDSMRAYDVQVGCENVYAELLDLQAGGAGEGVDPDAVVERLLARYEALWSELLAPEQFGAEEMWRVEQRIDRLNDLGFDVDELDLATDEGGTVRLQPRVVEAGHHARELERLTGLTVEDNQARRLLTDIAAFAAHVGAPDRDAVGDRWRHAVFDRLTAMVPPELRGRLEPAEIFHEVLEHRWLMSERAGREIDLPTVMRDYLRTQLPNRAEERLSGGA